MVQYNFKRITIVPSGKELVDIVLSKTQRQTPTVIHKGNAINRIRQFYMRKTKFTQQTVHDRLTTIIEDFPRLDDIHPFYSDLLNVLYDKDHYKLALGQLNTARNLVDRVGKEYVRLLKFGDSLYRCKQLKVAALGRMATLMKKQGPSLAYLEQVRQHMARLPSIDPNTRTLLICGYPNVGKSSFINKVTRADVDVQPYAFTTKSLFVGHLDYKYLRWQVIDTPGILDHPLEDRNTIEMLSITALAHLRSSVLFFVDLSGACGYSLHQQAALFHSIKPLFANKPLVIVCNKIDLQPFETLPEDEKNLLREMAREAAKCGGGVAAAGSTQEASMQADEELEGCLLKMSTMTDEGVMAVKNAACEKLLQQRVELKMKSKKMDDVVNRIHVAMPRARDNKERPPVIPPSVLARQAAAAAAAAASPAPVAAAADGKKTEKDLQEEFGGAGVYAADLRKNYLLEDDSWKYDIVPEIMDGHNIADFIDADILLRLEELEREDEEQMREEGLQEEDGMEEDELAPEQMEALTAIRQKKKRLLKEHHLKKSTAESRPLMPRTADRGRSLTVKKMQDELGKVGIDASAAAERIRSRSLSRKGRKRDRSTDMDFEEVPADEGGDDDMDVDGRERAAKRLRARSLSRSRSRSRGPVPVEAVPGEGFKDTKQKIQAMKLAKKVVKKRSSLAKKGEADRGIVNVRPKHLFTGKRGIGKTDRR